MTTDALLVDLDGPLTRLLPDPQHLELAAEIARAASERSGRSFPPPVDHVAFLRELAAEDPTLATDLAAHATAAELTAARQARPAAGAPEFLAAAHNRGIPVAVVSNNAHEAVTLALTSCGLAHLVDHVSARQDAQLGALKPAPDLLLDAMAALSAGTATMYGDTEGDMHAAAAAGIPAIGVTADPERAARLRDAGAIAVVEKLDPTHVIGGGR